MVLVALDIGLRWLQSVLCQSRAAVVCRATAVIPFSAREDGSRLVSEKTDAAVVCRATAVVLFLVSEKTDAAVVP